MISGILENKNRTARRRTNTAMDRYTHWTLARAFSSSKLKKTYEPRTGAMTVPIPLKAWEMLIRISEYRGGPQTGGVSGRYF